ncbi:MAG: DUF3060 domain-containing protein [Gloeomargarita sp. GXS_bins_116]
MQKYGFLGGVVLVAIAFVAPGYSQPAPITISGFGGNATHDCGNGRNVTIDAANTTVTLRGMCKQVEITGAGNTVNLNQVERIVVTGTMNRVTYRNGVNNRQPVISNTGFNNQVTRQP